MTLSLENESAFKRPAKPTAIINRPMLLRGTSARGIEPGAYEPPAGSECQGRIGTPVDIVLAADDHHERADPEDEGCDASPIIVRRELVI